MTSREELEAAIEAILFVATEPVASEKIHALFAEDDREAVEAALEAVIARYQGGEAQGVVADFAAGGVRLVTRPALQGYLRKFFQVTGRTKMSMAALETLAIVAYRQPITAPEIQELRGVSSAGVLKTLLDHRLVRISGRKEVVGKPFLYCTSRDFLIRFGLNRLQDLPPLEELEQMLAAESDADGGSTSQQSLDLRYGEHQGDPEPGDGEVAAEGERRPARAPSPNEEAPAEPLEEPAGDEAWEGLRVEIGLATGGGEGEVDDDEPDDAWLDPDDEDRPLEDA